MCKPSLLISAEGAPALAAGRRGWCANFLHREVYGMRQRSMLLGVDGDPACAPSRRRGRARPRHRCSGMVPQPSSPVCEGCALSGPFPIGNGNRHLCELGHPSCQGTAKQARNPSQWGCKLRHLCNSDTLAARGKETQYEIPPTWGEEVEPRVLTRPPLLRGARGHCPDPLLSGMGIVPRVQFGRPLCRRGANRYKPGPPGWRLCPSGNLKSPSYRLRTPLSPRVEIVPHLCILGHPRSRRGGHNSDPLTSKG